MSSRTEKGGCYTMVGGRPKCRVLICDTDLVILWQHASACEFISLLPNPRSLPAHSFSRKRVSDVNRST